MAVVAVTVAVASTRGLEWIDITSKIVTAVRDAACSVGIVLVDTRHTTTALVLRKLDGALEDLKGLTQRLVPQQGTYRHNDARYSDCERGNGQAHLRAALLGAGVMLGVAGGELLLEPDQAIILAEFDGPRRREVTVQIVGG